MNREMNFMEMVNNILDKTEEDMKFSVDPKLLKTKREENKWTHYLCLPGCMRKDVSAKVEKPFIIVTVSGQDGESFTQNGEYTMVLPPRADVDNVTAFMEMGILTIEIPVLPKEEKKIQITSL